MSGPSEVRLKRRRNESGPDTLLVERQTKRAFANIEYRELRYVRQEKAEYDTAGELKNAFAAKSTAIAQQPRASRQSGAGKTARTERRTFQLANPLKINGIAKTTHAKKYHVPTITEHRKAVVLSAASEMPSPSFPRSAEVLCGPTTFKRPGKGSAIVKDQEKSRPEGISKVLTNPEEVDTIAADLHQFALHELAKQPKPKVTAMPRLSGSRSREIHRERTTALGMASKVQDLATENESEYVYDTYVLAPARNTDAPGCDSLDSSGDVGFLVIADDDQETWDAYLEDEAIDKSFDTDDEDENAEGYFGADYPEDELVSDDEFDSHAYGFRLNGASDDEEWDNDANVYSDDGNDRTINPWRHKTASQFGKHLTDEDGY